MNDETEPRTQAPLPVGVVALRTRERHASLDTVELLQELLRDAQTGQVTGLAVVALHANGSYGLRLCGAATEEPNQMGIVGMVAALQKMAMELY
jgi:hypothetical protein